MGSKYKMLLFEFDREVFLDLSTCGVITQINVYGVVTYFKYIPEDWSAVTAQLLQLSVGS